MKISVTALATIAGIATASPYFEAGDAQGVTSAQAGPFGTLTIDIANTGSWDFEGAPGNTNTPWGDIDWANCSCDVRITGIGWDVNISTFGDSWLSEATMRFEDALYLTVGAGDDFAGSASYSSGGILDLTSLTTPLDFFLSADNILDIEFFESFDDVENAIDAIYGAGSTLTIQYELVPAPGALAILGLSGLVASRRRRLPCPISDGLLV